MRDPQNLHSIHTGLVEWGKLFYIKTDQKMRFYVDWNCVGSLKIKEIHTEMHPKITEKIIESLMSRTCTRNHLRILVLPTQVLIKIYRTGKRIRTFVTSWDSASFTKSNNLSGEKYLQENSEIHFSEFNLFTGEYPSTFEREC